LEERAMIYEMMKKYDKAIADWTTALGIKPNDPEYLGKRADIYRKIGDQDKAIADLEKIREQANLQPK